MPDPATPLWRAAQVFRLLSCVYALGFQLLINPDLKNPGVAWLLFAVLIGWSAACAVAYLQGFGRRPAWVVAEIVIVVALMLSTELIASDQWVLDNQSWPTTLWATNATISAAILFGPIAGMLTGVVVMAASAALKGYVSRWGWRPRRRAGRIPNWIGPPGCPRRSRSVSGCPVRCMTGRSRCWRWWLAGGVK